MNDDELWARAMGSNIQTLDAGRNCVAMGDDDSSAATEFHNETFHVHFSSDISI